jgi:hypothetical protein
MQFINRLIKMKKIILVIFAALVSLGSFGGEPSPATMDRFLNAYQFEPIREQWAFRLEREMKGELTKLRATPGLTDASKSALDKYEAVAIAELAPDFCEPSPTLCGHFQQGLHRCRDDRDCNVLRVGSWKSIGTEETSNCRTHSRAICRHR